MSYAIGIDLGGTNIKLLAVDTDGKELQKTRSPSYDSEASGGKQWIDKIPELIGEFELTVGKKAKWIGISAPGLADRHHRCIISLPGRLQGLEYLDWTDLLKRKSKVTVLNDAHAALYGELWQGSASNYKNVIFLTLGTGVGGAILINGELYHGTLGRAGHFGHTCLNPDMPLDIKNTPGSIEDMIGECTISERTGGRFHASKALVQAYLDGDTEAEKVWLRSVYMLACSLVSFINIIDPEVILLGGGISKSGNALMKPLNQYLDKVEWRPEGHRVDIQFATLGNRAGALGAARYAMLHGDA